MRKKIHILAAVLILAAISLFNPVTARAEIGSGTCGTCSWVIDDDGTLTISPTDGTSGTLASVTNNRGWPWYSNRSKVKKVVIDEGVAANTKAYGMFYEMSNCTDFQVSSLDTSATTIIGSMFKGCTSLADTSGLAGWDTSNITDMNGMFSGCKALADTSGLAGWNTGSVTNMAGMFSGCSSLTNTSGLANWDTNKVTSMYNMFSDCTSLADTSSLANWNTSKVTSMDNMFRNCTSLADTSGLADWNTGNVINMSYMFNGCTSLADTSSFANWNTGKVTNMDNMFYGCKSLADTSGFANWNTGKVKKMGSVFDGCTSLADTSGLADWDTGSVTDMSDMFYGCTSLTDTSDLVDWDTGSVTNMNSMFNGCTSLTDTSDLVDWDTGSVTNMSYMFNNCNSLTDTSWLADWDTGNVTNMSGMFNGCTSLADTSGLVDWDTGSVTNMNYMFKNCTSLADTSGLAGWNTSKVTGMSEMFYGCTSLADTSGLEGWNTSSVTSMSSMFRSCASLTDTSGLADWDTGNAMRMESMFSDCSSLSDISGLADWDTGSVTNMSYMFNNCNSLTDTSWLADWDTGNVTDMSSMFYCCTSLTDASGFADWNTDNVTDMRNVFYNCSSLEEIDISGWDTSKVTTFANIFAYDNKLKRVNLGENIKFTGNGATGNKRLTLPTPPASQDGIRYTGKWIREDDSYGPFTSAQMITNYTPEMAGWWVWEEVPVSYSITYAAPEEAAGSMAGEKPKAAESHEIPKCGYVLFANRFDHWVDGQGRIYPDKGTIPANTYSVGSEVTLTAVFVPIDTKVNMEDGTFEVTLRAGEKAKFDGIPAGTAYQVFEETPDGWLLVGQVNSSGQIEPLKEAKASFINRYQPDITSVQFSGSKTLDSRPAEEGSYTFQLLENGVVIQEKTILPGGFIQFDPITYESSDAGVHTYIIREVDSGDESIEHDPHEETITVTVTDNGDGTLSSAASYDADGIIFANRIRPGSLRIGKTADGATDANEEDTFRFRITFRNENGQPVDKDIYWYVEEDGVPVSGTQTAVP